GVHIDTGRWYRLCKQHHWPGVLEGLFHCVHEQEIADPPRPWDEILWGDKTPAYMAELPLLATLYPGARFVHLVRDPRDCVLSTQEAWGNTPLRTAQEGADRVRRCRAGGAALGRGRDPGRRYGALVGAGGGRLGAAFDFLGVPTPANAGEFLRVPENLGSARGAGRVMTGERQKWRQRMSPGLRRRIEEVAGDLLDAYGYEREFPDIR